MHTTSGDAPLQAAITRESRRIPSAPPRMSDSTLELDCVILGGGAAGLFTLAHLRAQGHSALLLERDMLGAGQTRCAQGIIHGGTKYSLGGLLGADSRAIAEMPERWLDMAEGRVAPSLQAARLRSRHGWLWRSDGMAGRLGMLGARLALRVRPEEVAPEERPALLRAQRGAVLRLAEPIFDPGSVLMAIAEAHRGCIARHHDDSLQISDRDDAIDLTVELVDSPRSLQLRARRVVLAAGTGNEVLRQRFGRPDGRTQRRPLHQVLVRSPILPWIDGHCIDGDATRVTMTSERDAQGRVIWHLGGRLAEQGVALDRTAQIVRAIAELRAILPGVELDGAEVATYRVDRAEPLEAGRRPDDARLIDEGAVLSLWPTKLALAPRAAELVGAHLAAHPVDPSLARTRARVPPGSTSSAAAAPAPAPLGSDHPLPACAQPPWHDALEWTPVP